ncbi:MAG: hypothetical protein JSW11_11910 [Candidatus Heimdallarchaeota archaeon]|nr:MAG: hypothetical protein JSW11_11910 [Candidatus Heimdallarchaeota archaeon]
MEDSTISSAEIKQLLYYMNRVKSFEKTFMIQKDSMERLIWGLLLIGAGILDGVFSSLRFFGLASITPWLLAMVSGLIIQGFSDRHLINIYSRKTQEKEDEGNNLFLIGSFIIMGAAIGFFNFTELHYLTFPTVALISGFTALVVDKKYYLKNEEILSKMTYLVTPIVSFTAAIVMLLGTLIDPTSFVYGGIIFGFTFGTSFSLVAFWNRRQVDIYIEKIDIPE